jgi:AAA domain
MPPVLNALQRSKLREHPGQVETPPAPRTNSHADDGRPAGEARRNGDGGQLLPAAAARDELLLDAWLDLEIAPRDYLLGGVFCTATRAMFIGETGIGKTLCAGEIAGGIASGKGALGWSGQRPARVMYLDGELPAQTFKDRMKCIAARYGRGLSIYGYSRDRLHDGEPPPLNGEPGQKWLLNEISIVKPDAIIFDSVMALFPVG